MEKNIHVKNLSELPEVVEQIKELIEETKTDILLFYGSMGAGKTTIIKELCAQLDVIDVVTSPTFALINEYHTSCGKPIYHFDFYRINSIEEAFDIGYEEYFYSGNLSLIEWPEKITALIPEAESGVTVSKLIIESDSKEARQITFICQK